jgi:transcriptional regulator GlxA family with amidase domain
MAEHNRGILNPREGFRHFRLTRREPAAALRWCLQGHWIVEALGAEVPARESVDEQVAATEAFLRARLREPDATVARIGAVVATMEASPALSVQEVAARHGVSVRALQRLFRRWVGVSPKWVLQRLRLQEAAERVDEAGAEDAAATALELGYYDQAHFINDFRAGVGRSPRRYARSS